MQSAESQNTFEKISHDILKLIDRVRNVSQTGIQPYHSVHRSRIQSFVTANHKIQMVLPAFPAKSPNPHKTMGQAPDYGEVLALQKLHDLCVDIGRIYAPGAEIIICSDGRVFSDIVQVSDDSVDLYSEGIRRIIREKNLEHLQTFSLEDLFGSQSYDEMRRHLIREFSEPLDVLKARVKSDLEARALFNGIHRFMFEDQLVLNPTLSKSQTREVAKELAYDVILRSNAWSRLVEQAFPNAVRLSIHPQHPHSEKIGVQLLPSNNAWRTPWHSVTAFDGERFFLLPRAEAISAGGRLMYSDSIYPYYELAQTHIRARVADL